MKKKFLSILLGLFLSVGLAYPSVEFDTGCGIVTTVDIEYFDAICETTQEADFEYIMYLADVVNIMCA